MAADVGVMRALGHERFHVVGHHRGAYVATRLATMPGLERLERTEWRFAAGCWHWWFFGQLDKPAERVIDADPDAWYGVTPDLMGPDAFTDLRRALHDPEVVHAMLEDDRAGLRGDREHDERSRAEGVKIACPLLLVSLIRTAEIDCGHHVAEEEPRGLAALLRAFLA